jgi:hypothetical protein
MAEQSLSNHTKYDPVFHFFLAPLALALVIGASVNLVRYPGWSSGWHEAAAIWAFVATFKMRIYSLKVQDRVIRLEERLRLHMLCQEPTRSRIGELNEGQLISLRFACDSEVPTLVEQTLSKNLDRKQIKQAIKAWRADHWRV